MQVYPWTFEENYIITVPYKHRHSKSSNVNSSSSSRNNLPSTLKLLSNYNNNNMFSSLCTHHQLSLLLLTARSVQQCGRNRIDKTFPTISIRRPWQPNHICILLPAHQSLLRCEEKTTGFVYSHPSVSTILYCIFANIHFVSAPGLCILLSFIIPVLEMQPWVRPQFIQWGAQLWILSA